MVREVRESGLTCETNAMFTNVEGEWEAVFAGLRRCHELVHEMGAPRITTSIRMGTRTDREQTMDDKLRSAQEKMQQQ